KHRDTRMLGETNQRLLRERAQCYRVHHSRQHPCGVFNGLAAAELRRATGQSNGMTTEFTCRNLQRQASACRRLLEEQCDGLASEQFAMAAVAAIKLKVGCAIERTQQP